MSQVRSRIELRSRVRRLILDPVTLLKDAGFEYVWWAEGANAPPPGPVATWNSEVGTATLSQNVPARRPQMILSSNMGGLPAVRFDGADDRIQASGLLTGWTRPVSVVAIFRPLALHPGTIRRLFGLSVAGIDAVTFGKALSTNGWLLRDSAVTSISTIPTVNLSYMVIAQFDASPAFDFAWIFPYDNSGSFFSIMSDLGDGTLNILTLGASSNPAGFWNCEIALFAIGRVFVSTLGNMVARLFEWGRRYI